MQDISYIVAFTTGLLTFFAPCTFVALPAFLAYITSQATDPDNLDSNNNPRKLHVFKSALAYVSGFILVFTLLGVTATALGSNLLSNKALMAQIGGLFMVLGGLFMLFGEKVPMLQFLYRERKFNLDERNHFVKGYLVPFLIGLTTAFAWTPCIGPVLGSILFLAGVGSDNPLQGGFLLFVHALGIAIPFLILALLFDKSTFLVKKLGKYTLLIHRISAVILIVIGLFLLFGAYDIIGQQVYKIYIQFGFKPY